jgi:hypothetical protein
MVYINNNRSRLEKEIDKIRKDADSEGMPVSLLPRWRAWVQGKMLENEHCLVQQFFEEQAKLPPLRRSKGAMIVCKCKNCNPYSL